MECDGPTQTRPDVAISAEFHDRITLAWLVNDVPLVTRLVLTALTAPLDDLTVTVTLGPGLAEPLALHVARLTPGAPVVLEGVAPRLSPERLAALTEALPATLEVAVASEGTILARSSWPLTVLTADDFVGFSRAPELLAAFVAPNHPSLAPILRRVADSLGETTGDPSLAGYQRPDPERVRAVLSALWTVLTSLDLTYVTPPASFERDGQKVRPAHRLLDARMGTCLDLALLHAACVEAAGLHPVVVLTQTHALSGAWLTDEHFPEAVVESDAGRLRSRSALGHLLIVEAVALTSRPVPSFAAACEAGLARLPEAGAPLCVIDVTAARLRGVRPLAALHEASLPSSSPSSSSSPSFTSLTPAPAAPKAEDKPGATIHEEGGEKREDPQSEPSARIARWKRSLLDLSLRNRLLNFRPTKSTVPLQISSLPHLEDVLADGGVLTLRPRVQAIPDGSPRSAALLAERTGSSPDAALLAEEFARGKLAADLEAPELDRRLTAMWREARLAVEESGANTLYLTLGMLRWYETSTAEQPRLAPLILLPVQIDRPSAREGCTLRRSDEEPRINLTLIRKLEQDHGIRVDGLDPLPEDESGLDVPAILAAFRQAIVDQGRWEVLEQAALAHLSFTKFLMWRDLEERSAELMASDVVRHLVEGSGEPFPGSVGAADPDDLDGALDPSVISCPLDCDSSQLAAVAAAADGGTFVLEGPPGTGKSQTITNVVAHCLAAGRTVLFVAEKRAALDVVYRRLERLGLGPFCLELHSNKGSRSHVTDQLRTVLELQRPTPPSEWESRCRELASLRSRLNDWVRTAHEARPLGLSVFDATAAVVGLAASRRMDLPLADPGSLDATALTALRGAGAALAAAAARVEPVPHHPWGLVGRPSWDPALGRAVEGILTREAAAIGALESAAPVAASRLGLSAVPRSRAGLTALAALCRLLRSTPRPPAALVDDPDGEAIEARMAHIVATGRRRDELEADLGRRYDVPGLLSLDLPALRAPFAAHGEDFVLLRWFFLRGPRAQLLERARARDLGTPARIVADLDAAAELLRLQGTLDGAAEEGRRLLGRRWNESRAPWDEVEALVAFAHDLRRNAAIVVDADPDALSALRRRLAAMASEGADALADGTPAALELDAAASAVDALRKARDELAALLEIPADPTDHSPDHPTAAAAANGARRAALASLRDVCAFVEARGALAPLGLAPLGDAVAAGELAASDVGRTLDRSVLQAWLESTVAADDRLRTFRGSEHERLLERFRSLDGELRDATKALVASRLASRLPSPGSAETAVRDSEMGVLQRELKKQRRHRSVRWLLRSIPTLLTRLCPCLLMSPLSVAQYLDPSTPPFDLVVFDEASQIPVWDAVGAVARGRRLVVVGDSRQLPPTSFFQKVEDDTAPCEDDVEELESILDECVAAGLPRRTLRWHYRSRHESLIAFSNHHYYEDRLVTFPAPCHDEPRLGVTLHAVPDGVYDRGGTGTNRREAQALVAELIRRVADPAERHRSMGVVTFSTAQQALVETLLDEAARSSPALEAAMSPDADEPLFVKNLENVQGDERDVILFSICYGPDAAGRVAMNFGPLNRPGGERRLNVAVTRAREQLVIVATLRPEQIDLTRTSAVGAAHLKAFLEYAQRVASAPADLRVPPDDLRLAAKQALEEAGHEVHADVGASGRPVDLAVVDPERPGRYVLGVEFDGPRYAAALTARDRDRLRPEVLSRLGWRLHRVWSADWWLDPEGERRRLLAAVEAATAAAREEEQRDEGAGEEMAGETTEEKAEETTEEKAEEKAEESEDTACPAEPGMPYLRWRSARPLGKADEFHAPDATRTIAEAAAAVVRTESPVAASVVCARILEAFGVGRATRKARDRVEACLDLLAGDARPRRDGAFLWAAGSDEADIEDFRVPSADDPAPREADEIHPAEVALALAAVLRSAVALPQESLLREGARLLGFARLGSRVRSSLDAGLAHLAASGRCVIAEGQVRLPT